MWKRGPLFGFVWLHVVMGLRVNNGAIGVCKQYRKNESIGNNAKFIFLLYEFIGRRVPVINTCWRPGFVVYLRAVYENLRSGDASPLFFCNDQRFSHPRTGGKGFGGSRQFPG